LFTANTALRFFQDDKEKVIVVVVVVDIVNGLGF